MSGSLFDPDDADQGPRSRGGARDALGEPDALRALARQPGRAPRPRDAATLILYRLDDDRPRVLMGRRSRGHDFMPDKYVFPGGRVDPGDGLAPAASELSDEQAGALRVRSRRQPRAFPLATVRETYEETGLVVGRAAEVDAAAAPANWREYCGHGVAPCLASFAFVGRAVTPPMRHKRFDARFFMADASACLIDDRPPVEGRELVDLRWLSLAEARDLDLPNVTRFVLGEVADRLAGETPRPFLLRWTRAGHVRERL